jgi:hypothetical protein
VNARIGAKMRGCGLLLFALLFWNTRSSAQVVLLAFASDPSGISLSGSGSSAVSMNFGNVQAFGGTVPSGVTKSRVGNSWILSTTIDVQVTQIGILSSSYTLTARLQAADLKNTWKLKAVSLSTASATITTTGAYGTTPNSFSLTVPFSASAGAINNTINITATAN